jgi:hypothetical protein
MHFPEAKTAGPLPDDATPPPEKPTGMQRFYRHPFMGRLWRLLMWWLIFTGIYASTSVCPFCGQAGCPVGAAGAGLVGGFFALIVGKGKAVWDRGRQGAAHLRAKFTPTR